MTPPTVALPPAGPALTLHQAADQLRRAAKQALAEMPGNDYWRRGWASGIENAVGGPEGVLAGLLSPPLALDLADWLDAIGCAAVKHAAGGWGNEQSEITDGHPTAVALAILGETS